MVALLNFLMNARIQISRYGEEDEAETNAMDEKYLDAVTQISMVDTSILIGLFGRK